MAATMRTFESRSAGLRSLQERKFSNQVEPPALVWPDGPTALSQMTREQIYRRWRCGVSLEAIAAQFGLSRSRAERLINELRAERLLEKKLAFVNDPSFDDPAAVAQILGPFPKAALEKGSGRARAPQNTPSYLAHLYQEPLLSRQQERHLFLKMNYLKYHAHQLRVALEPGDCDAAQLDEIERLQEEALDIKNRIIRANLRLVVSIAKKRVGPTNNFFELVSDGNMSLIRAVERFDANRGPKFSTYATWSIVNNFARAFTDEKRRRARFVAGHEHVLADAPDNRLDDGVETSDDRHMYEVVESMLLRLDDRERRILIRRYGIGGIDVQTLEQIGRDEGVTKERVRQIAARAHDKLRGLMREERLELAVQ
jgi:RNA polymerase primary sigma factor